MPDNLDIFSRAAVGDPVAEKQAAAILLSGLKAYFRSNFSLPLQRCIGLPDTLPRLLRPKRDYWLRLAYEHCAGDSDWQKCKNLAEEVSRMKTVFWPAWKSMEQPPSGTSELRQALFHVMHLGSMMNTDNPAIPDTARQISNIVKNSAEEISQHTKHDEGS